MDLKISENGKTLKTLKIIEYVMLLGPGYLEFNHNEVIYTLAGYDLYLQSAGWFYQNGKLEKGPINKIEWDGSKPSPSLLCIIL